MSQVISAHPQLITCITWHSSNDNVTGWSHVFPFSPLLPSPSSCQSPKQLQLWAPWFGPHGMMTSHHHHHHNGMMNQMKKRSKRHHPSLGPQVSFFISSHFYLTNNAFQMWPAAAPPPPPQGTKHMKKRRPSLGPQVHFSLFFTNNSFLGTATTTTTMRWRTRQKKWPKRCCPSLEPQVSFT